jgi:hypothetical protein
LPPAHFLQYIGVAKKNWWFFVAHVQHGIPICMQCGANDAKATHEKSLIFAVIFEVKQSASPQPARRRCGREERKTDQRTFLVRLRLNTEICVRKGG